MCTVHVPPRGHWLVTEEAAAGLARWEWPRSGPTGASAESHWPGRTTWVFVFRYCLVKIATVGQPNAIQKSILFRNSGLLKFYTVCKQ